MSNYKTVRIDNESMKKLEEIADTMEAQLKFKISKASALEHIINEHYEIMVVNHKNLILSLLNESSKEKKLEFQRMLEEIKEQGKVSDIGMDENGNFVWKRR